MGRFKEHGVLIYLATPLYRAFIKLQADMELGRSYAALLPFVEGLYSMGYISQEVYSRYRAKYSKPLPVQKSLSQVHEQQRLKQLEKQFSQVAQEWDTLKTGSQRYWLKKAGENRTVPHAQAILAKEGKQ